MGSFWGPQKGPRQRSVGFNVPEVYTSAGKCVGNCVEVLKTNWLEMCLFLSGCVGHKLLDLSRLANRSSRTQDVSCKLREKPLEGASSRCEFPRGIQALAALLSHPLCLAPPTHAGMLEMAER